LHRRALGPKRQANTLEQAQQIELGFRPQVIENLVLGKIRDPDDQVLTEGPEFLRQAPECGICE
jgi:hypothetical protein